MSRFDNKIAIITGSSGIGRACAIRLAQEGATVLTLGIDDKVNQEFEAIIAKLQLNITVRKTDVSKSDEVSSAFEYAQHTFGGVDIIINSAAIHPYGTAVTTSPETFAQCMAVNVGSIHLTAHFGVPIMEVRGGGSIVNISSVQGFNCQQNVVAYVASKGAIHAMTRAMALDHAAINVRVNSISPGSIRTPILAHAARTYGGENVTEDEAFARFGAAHPIGRIGEPEEVASLATYLCSDEASFITGSDYKIDGGLTAGIGVK